MNDGRINVLNGPDETMLCGLVMGAQGAIGTTYNFAPDIAMNIYNSFKNNKIEEARFYQQKLNKLIDVGIGHNIAYWKEFMSVMGYNMGTTMFPAKKVTKEEFEDLKNKIKDII